MLIGRKFRLCLDSGNLMNRNQIIALWLGILAALYILVSTYQDFRHLDSRLAAWAAIIGLYNLFYYLLVVLLITLGIIVTIGYRSKPRS